MDVATPDLRRLAERVKRRRVELNLSVKRAAVMAGMSKDTWSRVENPESGDGLARHVTYDKIEAALGWTVGSCRKILDGGEPALLDPDLHGDVRFVSVPAEDQETVVRQVVQNAMVAATDTNASTIRKVNDLVIEMLREHGILPSAD